MPAQDGRRLLRERAVRAGEAPGQLLAGCPCVAQVPDASQRVAPLLEAGDQCQPPKVRLAVEGDPPPARRRLEQPHRLVFADGAHGQPGSGGQHLNRPARLGGRHAHGLDSTGKYRYGKYRDSWCRGARAAGRGAAARPRVPGSVRTAPPLLGGVPSGLAPLDRAPLRAALADAGVVASSDAPAFLATLAESAGRLGRTDLSAAARWLAGHLPAAGRAVIGHGDIHPFNLLTQGERWTLLDWTSALIADPAYDLAFTTLMLRHPPLAAPAPLRPIIGAAGAPPPPSYLPSPAPPGGPGPDRARVGTPCRTPPRRT